MANCTHHDGIRASKSMNRETDSPIRGIQTERERERCVMYSIENQYMKYSNGKGTRTKLCSNDVTQSLK